ncbi:MAG: hypothetical protein V3T05_13120 [Myxococcota bacterium]
MQPRRGSGTLLLGLIGMAASVPAALGLEALLRVTVLPPDFELIRTHLEPTLTPLVWLCVGLAVAANVAAFVLQKHMQRSPPPPEAASSGINQFKQVERLMVTASVAQMPAILAAFAYLMGAAIAPVGWTMLVSTIGVMLLWFALETQ